MIPSDDILTGLPAPIEDEPPSVRRDIADELADHLACAYRREQLKTADELTAQQRVLDRFGDPRRLAYQLWFQALWGRIMLHRFARIVQGLKIVGGVVVLVLVVQMVRQQSALYSQIVSMTANYNSMQSQVVGTRNLLEQVLQRLPQPPQPATMEDGMGSATGMMGGDAGAMGMSGGPIMPGSEMGMALGMMAGASPASSPSVEPVLIVKLTMQVDKQEPAADCVVSVIDENGANLLPVLDASYYAGTQSQPFGSQPSTVYRNGSIWMGHSTSDGKVGGRLFPGMQGTVRFGKATATQDIVAIEPGRYTISVEFNDGRRATRQVVIPPHANAKNHTEHMVCPGPSKNAYVVIHTPILPQELIDAGFSVVASVKRKSTTIEGTEWQTGYRGDDLFLDFDPKTGAPTHYDRNSGGYGNLYSYFSLDSNRGRKPGTKFGDLATQDRFLTLPSGEYEVMLGWWDLKKFSLVRRPHMEGEETGRNTNAYVAAGAAQNGVLTIYADTRDVLLDFSEGMLEAARAALKTKASTTEATTSGVEKKLPDNVLLNFTATWCGPCQQMNPLIDKLREQGYAVRNVDVDRERATAERFSITALPTFIQLAEGREVIRQTGATSEAQLLRMVQ